MTAQNACYGPSERELENLLQDALRIELREQFFALQALVDQYRSEMQVACEYIRE